MNAHPVVSREEWLAARSRLLEKEKSLTRAHDVLAAERRRMPWESVSNDYLFEGPAGEATLADLFAGRTQLIVYHHMLKPADPNPCAGCSMFADTIGHLAHLHARDTSLAFVSRAPIVEIVAMQQRMNWQLPWYSTLDEFNADYGVTSGFGLNVFIRRGEQIFRSYFTTGRGTEQIGSTWSFLDLTPLGRQETWEESPQGTPQTSPYQWWHLHDEYD